MGLIDLVRTNFPGLDTSELLEGYRQTVIKNINRRSAICAVNAGEVVGFMLSLFPEDAEISVTTRRAEDEKGAAPRPLAD
ncbi:hypothetical protein [Paenibacillus ihuae]|uniref:hypothetical protein n=1 Tax=Paenibacillus ihuae TaxID=1232431 RepID=UPI0006D57964|nr:hypothetical protein [Paenibacillus ihuae]